MTETAAALRKAIARELLATPELRQAIARELRPLVYDLVYEALPAALNHHMDSLLTQLDHALASRLGTSSRPSNDSAAAQ